jgi:OOP family OmpA-OmpF porin
MATISSFDFHGTVLDSRALASISQLAALVTSHPGLLVEVDANSDSAAPDAERLATVRAEAIRDALLRAGISANLVTMRALGNTRPIGPNNTAQERDANRRTEIVISGAPIGALAVWDRTYPLKPKN